MSLGVQFPHAITSHASNSIIRQASAFVNRKIAESDAEKSGVTSAEIKIELRDSDGYIIKQKNGYGKPLTTIDSLTIYNQRGTGQSAIIHNVVPLNEDHRSEIESQYGEKASADPNDIRYQKRSGRGKKSVGGDEYSTYGVHWGIEKGIISKKEAAIIWESIAKIEKMSYHYPRTINGESFINSENFMFVVDTNFRDPIVKTIYKFDDIYETSMAKAKELITSAEGDESKTDDAIQIIGKSYGYGYVTRYDFETRGTYGRENGRGEGADRSKDSGTVGTARQREWIFEVDEDSEQYQKRTNNLSDREVLEIAAARMGVDELTDGEKAALDVFKGRLDELKKLQSDREGLGELWHEQQFGSGDRSKAKESLPNRLVALGGIINMDNQSKKQIRTVPS